MGRLIRAILLAAVLPGLVPVAAQTSAPPGAADGLRRIVEQRLVGLAQRVLQRVEELRELEGEEFLGIEEGEAVLARQAAEFARWKKLIESRNIKVD